MAGKNPCVIVDGSWGISFRTLSEKLGLLKAILFLLLNWEISYRLISFKAKWGGAAKALLEKFDWAEATSLLFSEFGMSCPQSCNSGSKLTPTFDSDFQLDDLEIPEPLALTCTGCYSMIHVHPRKKTPRYWSPFV